MRFLRVLSLIVSLSFFIIACGCGGGGGGGTTSSTSESGLSYTGLTTEVTVTSDNATDLASEAFSGASRAGSLGNVMGVSYVEENKQSNRPLALILIQTLEESLLKADITSKSSSIVSGAITSESGTIPGDCGGNTSYTINVNDATGDFNATFDFNSYCSFNISFSGKINYSGKFDINTGNLLYFTASFDKLTVVDKCGSFTVHGNIYYNNISENTMTGTMNALWRDNSTGKVYKVENYIVTFTVGEDYVDFVITGRYYNPDYGYAVISTTTQFRIYEGGLGPSQGVLVVTGKTGIGGGSTKARLTALPTTQYKVEADTNGDGTYDWSTTKNWDEGC